MVFDIMAMTMAMMIGLAISFVSGVNSASCSSSTVTVTVNSAADVQNLTNALACSGGGAFNISWHSSVTIAETIEVSNSKDVTVTGSGSSVISPASGAGLFSVSGGSTLRLNGLVLAGGSADRGGAVDLLSSSSLFVSDCAFTNNNASTGGAIYASSSAIYITGNTSFEENCATRGGAIYLYDDSSMAIGGGTSFLENKAEINGGVLYASTNSLIDVDGDSRFSNNFAGRDGGALYLYGNSSMQISGSSSFVNNVAESDGGAMVAYTSASFYMNGNASFVNNTAGGSGGALHLSSSSFIAFDGNSTFDKNVAKGDGGAINIYGNSSMQIDGSTAFSNNSAEADGGAIGANSNVHVNMHGNGSFVDSNAGENGGAMYLYGNSSVHIYGSASCINNNAESQGGAVYLYDSSSLKIAGSTSFVNNDASLEGGAIYLEETSSVQFVGSTSFVDNISKKHGGAIRLQSSSSVQINGSSSFLNNFAVKNAGAIGSITNGSISISGNASFANNRAGKSGGALYASMISKIEVDGVSSFDNNEAGIDGGDKRLETNNVCNGALYAFGASGVHTIGHALFANNMAEDDGGALVGSSSSSIKVDGNIEMYNNSAGDHGGGVYIDRSSSITIDGNASSEINSARNGGGVMYASTSDISINGTTSFAHNSASSPGGGVIWASDAVININGYTYVSNNTGYDGGAILAQGSEIAITGTAIFADNAADREGGAIKTTDSTIFMAAKSQGVGLSSTNALAGGVVTSAQQLEIDEIGTISFVGNTAFDYGGALSLVDVDTLNISGVTFTSNQAEAGGAIALTPTALATGDFKHCLFHRNKATRGGALHLNGEGKTYLLSSIFYRNVAGETGGGIYNAGPLEVDGVAFRENAAEDGGLAIYNLLSTAVLNNVTFAGNILTCSSETYSYTKDTSSDSCRFELACAQCLEGCNSDLSNVTIDTETLPTCESIPEGVAASETDVTLQTFDIEAGYYRISSESPIVLECYQDDACIGGTNASNYCATGYEGPYCAVCAEGYASGTSHHCFECSGENRGLAVGVTAIVLVLLLFVALLGIHHLLQRVEHEQEGMQNDSRRSWLGRKMALLRDTLVKSIPLSASRIAVVVLQIVVQFTEVAGAVYPDKYEDFLSSMSLVNFGIGSILSGSCLVSTDFFGTLVLATVAPVVILLGCAGLYVIARIKNRHSSTAGPIVRQKHLSIALFVVFFVYSSVSFTIFQTFVCDSMDDGNAYLRADYSLHCFTERHKAYRVYATVMVFIYPVGIPVFFAWWLVRHRRELLKPDREANPHVKPYRCIWGAYRPSCYYYEVVECGRRIVLTGAAVFVLPDTAEQVAIVLLLALVFVFISESISPFESKADMWLYRWGNGIILASMYVALLLKVDLAGAESRSSSLITVLLIVAHVFMIFAVVVQTVLVMRELCASRVQEEAGPSRCAGHQRIESDAFFSGLRLTEMDTVGIFESSGNVVGETVQG